MMIGPPASRACWATSQALKSCSLIARCALWPARALVMGVSTASEGEPTPASVSAVPLALPLVTVWGANTGVGKTLASIGLANAARQQQVPFLYVKPVQTGFPIDSDARTVAAAAGASLQLGPHAAHLLPQSHADAASAARSPDQAAAGSMQPGQPPRMCKVLHAWAAPASPHLTALREGRGVSDADLVRTLLSEFQAFTPRLLTWQAQQSAAAVSLGLGLVETAGGVASPAPSGTLMCDALRPLRLPALLVGDARLGGISATLTAYESLVLRGYDVRAIVIFDGAGDTGASHDPSQALTAGLGNADAVRAHLHGRGSLHRLGAPPAEVVVMPACQPPLTALPSEQAGPLDDNLTAWLLATEAAFRKLSALLAEAHQAEVARTSGLRDAAMRRLWWPFTQHASLHHQAVQVVDSRIGEHLVTLQELTQPQRSAVVGGRPAPPTTVPALVPMFDACASWWTQAVGAKHQSELALGVAYAAGRYLHVLSPQVAHQLAVDAAERLLATVGGRWATRVFFSDDGSTAIEVALKMAFRTYLARLPPRPAGAPPLKLKVVGLENAYHGDTLGAMDCVAPSVYNAPSQAPWYRGRGLFLHPPYLGMAAGTWRVIEAPGWLGEQGAAETWPDLARVIAPDRDDSVLTAAYRQHIEATLNREHGSAHFAALVIEPVVQGAGGMKLVDPQFQRQLAMACRERGIPVVFDEVMAGLFRLGHATAAAMLRVDPDIACFAKLMTAGVVPMAATLASEAVFNAFKGDSKLQALLHGHSYTAYPVGCATTLAALDVLCSPQHNPNLCTPAGPRPTCPTPHQCTAACGRLTACWDPARIAGLSQHPLLHHVVACGTLFAGRLRGEDGGGYASTSAVDIVTRLRDLHSIYARPLGDVVYLMTTPTTPREACDRLLDALLDVLNACAAGQQHDNPAALGDGCVV